MTEPAKPEAPKAVPVALEPWPALLAGAAGVATPARICTSLDGTPLIIPIPDRK